MYRRMIHARSPLLRDESGFIVFFPLVAVTVILAVLILAGSVLNAPAPTYVKPTPPSLHVAASAGVVRSGGQPVQHIERGDTLWVVRLGNGLPMVFADSMGTQAIGIGEGLLVPVANR